ncbi:hypothetical protein H1Z61_16325 [Bacillus aquiflavi]|uniref:VCBS repeat-containing protein n=1 Tax=Bacillus aquiflavi TaxID=2672567 RepID=A0A6B3VY21_9BACI|nr:hypothetical protein [Bacillus aquiflavi]MBA4538649.1 hypothetical protein [Bacillus aquiflavi]NEY83009.1 hypothetical protein [Bacillus aquiflavi]UAC49580.1 hypothetical protein K6959_07135 [Bacillus aquiflavi]
MRKELLFAYTAFFLMSIIAITGAYAEEEASMIIISKDKIDVTGDGKKEIIYVKGRQLERKTNFLNEVYLEVQDSHQNTYSIDLGSGYKPKLIYQDFNGDGTKDIFVKISTDKGGKVTNHFLYTLANFTVENLTVPQSQTINGEYQDNYQAFISVDETKKTYELDLTSQKNEFDQLGLYQNGKLMIPTELIVSPYLKLKPVKMNGEQYGLRGIQQVRGIDDQTIAYLKSTWVYKDKSWQFVNSWVEKKKQE